MKCFHTMAACGLSALLLSGCSLLNLGDAALGPIEGLLPRAADKEPSSPDPGQKAEHKIANPPARTIRFDGREIVLGTAEVAHVSSGEFSAELSILLEQEKCFTAKRLVSKNPGVAEQVIWDRYMAGATDPLVPFIAAELSREVSPTISWEGLLASTKGQLLDAQLYHQTRASFVGKLRTEEPSDQEAEQLRVVAQRLKHPLVMVDALRLIALRELVAGRHAWGESLFLQAAEIADQHGDRARAAELWMLAATTANQAGRSEQSQNAWRQAVERQVQWQVATASPMNLQFWTRAGEQRPVDVPWPAQISGALLRFCVPVGCQLSPESPAELVLWCAMAAAQYEDAQPQLALVNFKQAEKLASGEDILWLRIAQSKCLAALGQGHAAAALLSEPASSKNVPIAMAATAAIGSAKLQAGAYQQGAQLIDKALHGTPEVNWPTRSQAEADYALAQLIIGDTDLGLEALHAAQEKFQSQGDYASLLQSLGNELRILELEDRSEAAQEIKRRIREIEKA